MKAFSSIFPLTTKNINSTISLMGSIQLPKLKFKYNLQEVLLLLPKIRKNVNSALNYLKMFIFLTLIKESLQRYIP